MDETVLYAPDGTPIVVGIVSDSMDVQKTRRKQLSVPVYDSRFIRYFASLLMDRPRHKFDCIVQYTGKRRTGKTTLAAQVALTIDPSFPPDGACFEIEDFNERLSSNPVSDPGKGIYPQAMLDEAGYDLFSQEWQDRVQRNFVKKFEVIGVKCQIIHFVLPHRKKLNKSIREEMVEYWINVQTLHDERGLAVLRRASPNEWEEDVFWFPMAAFVFDSMERTPWWVKYSSRKMAFVDKAASERAIEISGPRSVQTQRDKAIQMLSKEGVINSQIAKELGMHPSTVGRAIKRPSISSTD